MESTISGDLETFPKLAVIWVTTLVLPALLLPSPQGGSDHSGLRTVTVTSSGGLGHLWLMSYKLSLAVSLPAMAERGVLLS